MLRLLRKIFVKLKIVGNGNNYFSKGNKPPAIIIPEPSNCCFVILCLNNMYPIIIENNNRELR